MRHRAGCLVVAATLMWLAGAASANAATCNWIEDVAAGSWRDAGNWDCGVVPDGDDDVVIDGGLEVVLLEGHDEAAKSVTLTNFGRLWLGGGTLAIGSGGLSGGQGFIAQPGTVTVAGPWTHSADVLTIQDGANVTFNGSASFTGGELALDDTPPTGADDPIATFNGALTIGDGALVSTEGAQETDRPLRIGATGTVTARSATINVPARNAGTFTVASNETLFVVQMFEQVAGGTTTLESNGVFDGDIHLDGGALTGQGTVKDGVLNDGGTIDAPPTGTLTIGGMTQVSGQTLVAANETLDINSNGADQLGGATTVSPDGTLTVSQAQSWRLEGGTMALDGTLDGRLFMNRGSTGTLSGAGTVALDATLREGTIAPGASAGTLTFMEDLDLADGMTLEIELGGTALGIDFDWIDVEGAADLDGDVHLKLIGGFTPPGDSRYQFLTSGSRTGTFKSVTGAGGGFTLDYPGAPNFGARLAAPPAGPPPANTSAPFITGTQFLTCNPGTWANGGTPTKFEWWRVNGPNTEFVNSAVPDANSLNNLFSSSWVPAGSQIFCRVFMTNEAGTTTADSAPVTVGAPPQPNPQPPPPQPNPQPVPPNPEAALASASPAAVAKAFGLPSARRCLRGRKLVISLKVPAGVNVKSASILVRGKTIKARRVRGRLRATVDLRGFKSGRLTIALKVTTASGKTLRGKRTYRKCA